MADGTPAPVDVVTDVATALATYDPPTHTEVIAEADDTQDAIEDTRPFREWQAPRVASVTLDDTGTTDLTLGTFVIGAGEYPADVDEVEILVLVDMMWEDSTAINRLDGAQNIQIQKAAGAFTTCITLVDNDCRVSASGERGGTIFRGTADVKAVVDAAATYTVQLTDCQVDADHIYWEGVQVWCRAYHNP